MKLKTLVFPNIWNQSDSARFKTSQICHVSRQTGDIFYQNVMLWNLDRIHPVDRPRFRRENARIKRRVIEQIRVDICEKKKVLKIDVYGRRVRGQFWVDRTNILEVAPPSPAEMAAVRDSVLADVYGSFDDLNPQPSPGRIVGRGTRKGQS